MDRFIPIRPNTDASCSTPVLSLRNMNQPTPTTPYADLSTSLGIPPAKRRSLTFRTPPPRHAPYHLEYQRNSEAATSVVAPYVATQAQRKKRKAPYHADRVLDAPGIPDDFYLNLVDWGPSNHIAIALDYHGIYIYDATAKKVNPLTQPSLM